MSKVFVVLSHLEVEPNNFSSEVVKVFDNFISASKFAKKLKGQIKDGHLPEQIDIEELTLEQ